MSKGKVKEAFPGGNTSLGFFSYYSYILDQEDAERIFVIKGGPGVGKSTFMKNIAKEMVERGYDVELMHCSSDNNSLDGVVIPAIGVALLDGTAPHVVDPKNPGAVDEIIHLGDYWNESGMRENKKSIMEDNREVGRLFERAYRYIKAAACVYEDTAVINSWAIDTGKVNVLTDSILSGLFKNTAIAGKEGKERKLFASAITPDGLKNYLDIILASKRVYIIKGQQGTGTEKLLEKVKTTALERGCCVESYYCALHPGKLEHLVIPCLGAAFTTANAYHNVKVDSCDMYDLDACLDKRVISKYSDVIQYNKSEFEDLLYKAIETINRAKAIHDRMETYYIPNMDFEAVQICWEATLAKILEYAASNK